MEMKHAKNSIIFDKFYSIVRIGIIAAGYKYFWTTDGLSGSVKDVWNFQASRWYTEIERRKTLPISKKILTLQNQPEVQPSSTLLGASDTPHIFSMPNSFANKKFTKNRQWWSFGSIKPKMEVALSKIESVCTISKGICWHVLSFTICL